jgi:hypothetical protein
MPERLITLIIVCIRKLSASVRIDKDLPDVSLVHSGLKQGDALSPLLFNFAVEQGYQSFRQAGHIQRYMQQGPENSNICTVTNTEFKNTIKIA